MKRKSLLGIMGVLVAACGTTDSSGPSVSALIGGGPPPSPTTYSGRATVVSARVLFLSATVGDTGPLPDSGGSLQKTLLTVSIPGVIGATAASASTEGGNDAASSNASASDVALTVLGLGVSASLITSNSSAACVEHSPDLSGGSVLADLTVNGRSVTVTGAPNQTIAVPGGRVVINEQVRTDDSITVSALHVVLSGLADVVVAKSHSDIHCGN